MKTVVGLALVVGLTAFGFPHKAQALCLLDVFGVGQYRAGHFNAPYKPPYWPPAYYRPTNCPSLHLQSHQVRDCAYWSERCTANWGRDNANYYGCLRYHRC